MAVACNTLNKLTGFAPDAERGRAPRSPGKTMVASREDFPMIIEFEGRQWTISLTQKGGLQMTR